MLVKASLLHSPKCEQLERIVRMWFILTMGSSKGNEVRAGIWMSLKNITPNERTVHTSSRIVWFHLREKSGTGESAEPESR